MRYPLTLLLVALSTAACSVEPQTSFTTGNFGVVRLDGGDRYEVRFGRRALLRSAAVPLVNLRFAGKAEMMFGRFTFAPTLTSETTVRGVELDGQTVRLGDSVVLHARETANGVLGFDVTPLDGGTDGRRLQFECAPHGDFLGFGEQYSFIAMRGKRVPVWTEENGLGRAEKPFPPLGTLFSTYYPVPYFLDPKGMGFVSDSSAYQEFSLCEDGASTWHVDVWDRRPFTIWVLAGPKPLDVVGQLTTVTGRAGKLPDWAFDLWLSAQGGTDHVKWVVAQANAAKIPYSAVWVQDWLGKREFADGLWGVKYRWALDPGYYPGFTTLVTDLHAAGKKFLGYFNPFIPPEYDFYAEGAAKGYLIKNAQGDPYVFQISVLDGSLVDMTNPEAVEWFKAYARKAVTDYGLDGWMSDFGEWLPWDAVLFAGAAPYEHNLYPTRWHQASRDVLDELRPDGDYVLLTRSGHLREAGTAQVVWAGDQEATWDKYDGFPTAVRANISLSLSGVPFVTHDIAGFSGGPSVKELWLRWVELGAFTPIMRLHDGLKKLDNWYFYSDAESATFLARFAGVHTKLKPYLKELTEEYRATGHPLVRHYALVDGRRETWGIEDAYFLGNDLLVAPVLTPATATRHVVFPAGTWVGVFGQGTFVGPAEADVKAPVGTPAVFARQGSAVAKLLN